MAKQQKGGEFERSFSRWLSLWWTGGARKDLFWRSGGSGSVSTVNNQQAMAGDIVAVDPEGQALIAAVTFELKCGYKHLDPFDLVAGMGANKEFQGFFCQARDSHVTAQSKIWSLVYKKDRKHPIIFFPRYFTMAAHRGGVFVDEVDFVRFALPGVSFDVVGYRLEDFFSAALPAKMLELLETF